MQCVASNSSIHQSNGINIQKPAARTGRDPNAKKHTPSTCNRLDNLYIQLWRDPRGRNKIRVHVAYNRKVYTYVVGLLLQLGQESNKAESCSFACNKLRPICYTHSAVTPHTTVEKEVFAKKYKYMRRSSAAVREGDPTPHAFRHVWPITSYYIGTPSFHFILFYYFMKFLCTYLLRQIHNLPLRTQQTQSSHTTDTHQITNQANWPAGTHVDEGKRPHKTLRAEALSTKKTSHGMEGLRLVVPQIIYFESRSTEASIPFCRK